MGQGVPWTIILLRELSCFPTSSKTHSGATVSASWETRTPRYPFPTPAELKQENLKIALAAGSLRRKWGWENEGGKHPRIKIAPALLSIGLFKEHNWSNDLSQCHENFMSDFIISPLFFPPLLKSIARVICASKVNLAIGTEVGTEDSDETVWTPSASHLIKGEKKDEPSGLSLRVGEGASKEPNLISKKTCIYLFNSTDEKPPSALLHFSTNWIRPVT